MAINTPTYKFLAGAPSATQATAISNTNTAMATFMANAPSSPTFNPLFQPSVTNSGIAVAPDAAVANDQYTCWFSIFFMSAS